MIESERRLPHRDVLGQPVFITFRLHGSLPANRTFPPERVSAGRAFVAMDRVLDRATAGPLYLKMPEIAEMVTKRLREGTKLGHYQLHAYVIMPNHVHLQATSLVPAARWLKALKGVTAHQANRILVRSGQHFWQDESYDHLVKSEIEFGRIQDYIESNPVRAGLAATAEQWNWSSANPACGRCTD
ncbi:MAG: transposase [Candidatus Solibacter sp.]